MSAVAPLPGPTRPMTAEDYLAWEAEEELRWEFDGWQPVAMTGGTVGHQRVIGNLTEALRRRVTGGCDVFSEGVKLRFPAPEGGEPKHRYPDVMVMCEPLDNTALYAESAVLVVEVLSPSSVHMDRITKMREYAQVPGLESYLIVDPAIRAVGLYRMQDGSFVPVNATDTLDLGHGLVVTMDDIYRGVVE